MKRLASAALLALCATACSVPREAGFSDVARTVEQRTGHEAFWNRGGEADREVERAVNGMLAHELSVAEAVQIALLQNHELQAQYEELSVAQADLVQAGLLRNPVFTGFVHFPFSGTAAVHGEVGVEQDFLDLLLIPAKKRVATSAFEAAKRRVGRAVVSLAYDVRVAYFTLEGAIQVAQMRRAVLETAEAAYALSERQHEAQTISDLSFASEQNAYEDARVAVARADADVVAARERLARAMGLWGPQMAFRIDERLPAIPPDELPLDGLESLAIARRLDLEAARAEVQTNSYALALARNGRYLGALGLGANFEREAEGGWAVGPAGTLELPIFDQHQAEIARREALLRQSEQRLLALAVDVRSEVREARSRVLVARSLAEHARTVVIPLRERIVGLSQVEYGAMLLGVYQLLQAKRDEVNAYRDYIEAVRDYWIARADLGRAVGGRLPAPSPRAHPRSAPAQAGPSSPPGTTK